MNKQEDHNEKRPIIMGVVTPDTAAMMSEAFASDNLMGDVEFAHLTHIHSLIPRPGELRPNELGEPVHGDDGQVFGAIVQQQPLLIIFEVENHTTDWRHWTAILKSAAATRRTPLILLAQQTDKDLQETAQNYGVDLLISAQELLADLPNIIQKYDRRPDFALLEAACSEPLSGLALKGLALFNAGEYFEAHEELEDAWNADEGPARELYRGILQVGVAYLQIERGNYNGAIKMLLRVKQWLDPLPDVCRTVAVEQLRQDAAAVYEALRAAGPEKIDDFDRSLFKPVNYRESHPS